MSFFIQASHGAGRYITRAGEGEDAWIHNGVCVSTYHIHEQQRDLWRWGSIIPRFIIGSCAITVTVCLSLPPRAPSSSSSMGPS